MLKKHHIFQWAASPKSDFMRKFTCKSRPKPTASHESLFIAFLGGIKKYVLREDGAKKSNFRALLWSLFGHHFLDFLAPSSREMQFFNLRKKASKKPSWRSRRPGPRFAREFTYKTSFPRAPNPILCVNSRANRDTSRRRQPESLFGSVLGGSKKRFLREDGAKKSIFRYWIWSLFGHHLLDFLAPSSREMRFFDPRQKNVRKAFLERPPAWTAICTWICV